MLDRAALFGRLVELVRESQRRNDQFDEAVADYLGVTRTEAQCLDILEEYGPITAGRLSKLSRLTTGAVTKVVDRLEAVGYVRRVRDQDDRRRVILDVTPKMRRLAADLYEPPEPLMTKFQARFTDDELQVLVSYFELGNEMADARSARLANRLNRTRGR